MSFTFNTKTFTIQTTGSDSSEYVKDGATLAEPYRIRYTRTLPKIGIKNAVLRGGAKFTRVYIDAQGNPQTALITVSSSFPTSIPAVTLTEMEADFKAAAVTASLADALFRGKVTAV